MKDFSKSRKRLCDFSIAENEEISGSYSLLKLIPDGNIAISDFNFIPGQFVQVATPCNSTYLRRPISVCNIDETANQLWLLIRRAGKGTNALCQLTKGSKISIIGPLGNGFKIGNYTRPLLIGGGVGVAPLYLLGRSLMVKGIRPTFLLGARSESALLLIDRFIAIGDVHLSTDDGSAGETGIVTQNSVLNNSFDHIYCCGPAPMMKAVARIASQKAIGCDVSLENMMACGVGACLCCVEKTVIGNVCVCTEGPVFNIEQLTWNQD